MRPFHVAIVGSGPSGFFAAESLLKAADSSKDFDMAVDMLEMLPTPWGLVRSGVAPDHFKIKSISRRFEKPPRRAVPVLRQCGSRRAYQRGRTG
jgi:ferredoxin--NADP+ reductase